MTFYFSRFQYRDGFIFLMDEELSAFTLEAGTHSQRKQLALTMCEANRVRLWKQLGINTPSQQWEIVEVGTCPL